MKPLDRILIACMALATPYFSPNGGAQDAIVKQLTQAKKTVLCAEYILTNDAIVGALEAAEKRGVNVVIILDADEAKTKSSQTPAIRLAGDGIPVYLDAKHAIFHDKYFVIDGYTVITGSYNATESAEHANGENIVIIDGVDLAKAYTDDFEKHRGHSTRMATAKDE